MALSWLQEPGAEHSFFGIQKKIAWIASLLTAAPPFALWLSIAANSFWWQEERMGSSQPGDKNKNFGSTA